MNKTDQDVGEKIIAEFKKQGLLTDATMEKLKPKMVAGTLSSSDWKLAFETDRPKKEGVK
jgi:hypothetical protein